MISRICRKMGSIVPLGCLLAASGCSTYAQMRGRSRSETEQHLVKPVVAVVDFENRSSFSGKWNLEDGMAEIVAAELIQARRFTVLERREALGALGEFVARSKSFFGKESGGRDDHQRDADYMLRGAVTDFGVAGDASGWFGGVSRVGMLGRRGRARVAVVVHVSDVDTGQILSSANAVGSASPGLFRGSVDYTKVSFGGDGYFKTPLGRATIEAVDRAVERIVNDLPEEQWAPCVAETDVDTVIINGGHNVGVQPGTVFVARLEGRKITDPVTGDVIDTVPGKVTGRIEVIFVKPMSARAVILEGTVRRGDTLEQVR